MKLFALAVLAVVLDATQVAAMPNFKASIPGSANVNGVAAIGHVNPRGGGDRNSFGLDFAGAGRKWTTDLCYKDSDGDGQFNGAELGDPCCEWVKGGNEKLAYASASSPGDAASQQDPSMWASVKCTNGQDPVTKYRAFVGGDAPAPVPAPAPAPPAPAPAPPVPTPTTTAPVATTVPTVPTVAPTTSAPGPTTAAPNGTTAAPSGTNKSSTSDTATAAASTTAPLTGSDSSGPTKSLDSSSSSSGPVSSELTASSSSSDSSSDEITVPKSAPSTTTPTKTTTAPTSGAVEMITVGSAVALACVAMVIL